MARDFSQRSAEAELMDGEGIGFDEFRACLVDLAAVNVLTLAHRPTLAWLAQVTRDLRPGDRFSLLDVGFGHGDLLRRIYAWSVERGLQPDLVGVDQNPWSRRTAEEATPPGWDIRYCTGDVFAFEIGRPVDVIISSLFTHHLPNEAVVAFVAWMERRAARGWFVNDLHRQPVPFYGFQTLAWAARWHRFVRHDGPISIARSFRPEDWRRILAEAGLDPTTVAIRRRFPFRLCVGRVR